MKQQMVQTNITVAYVIMFNILLQEQKYPYFHLFYLSSIAKRYFTPVKSTDKRAWQYFFSSKNMFQTNNSRHYILNILLNMQKHSLSTDI